MPGYSYTTLDDPSATAGTAASGIDHAGDIVGSYDAPSGMFTGGHGFLEVSGVYSTLDDPSALDTFAQGINNTGQIVGYYVNVSGTHGFLLSGGSYTTLDGPPAATETSAEGINDAGQIVGYDNDDISSTAHGFLFKP